MIVEDEALLAEDLAFSLQNLGYQVTGNVSRGEEAIRIVADIEPDLILMDIKLAGKMDGLSTADHIHALLDVPIIYITGYSERDVLERAKKTRTYGFLRKPISFLELRSTIEMALYKHKADRRLRESEARLVKAEEIAHLGSWEWDMKSNEIAWSDEAFRIFGYEPQQIQPHWNLFLEHVFPEDLHKLEKAVSHALSTGNPPDLELRVRTVNGNMRVIHSRAGMISDGSGKPIRMVGASLDITERRRIEDLMIVQRDLGIGLSAVSNLTEALDLCIDAALRISGMEAAGIYEVNEESGMHLIAHKGLPPDFHDAVAHMPPDIPEFDSILGGIPVYTGTGFSELSPLIRQALSRHQFIVSAAIPISYQGKVILSLHLATRQFEEMSPETRHAVETIGSQIGGVVTRIRAEDAARESRKNLETLVDAFDSGFALKSRTGQFLYINRALASQYGIQPQDVIGKSLSDVSPELVAVLRKEKLHEVLETKRPLRFIDRAKEMYFENILVPILDRDGLLKSVAVFSNPIDSDDDSIPDL
jgi:PAS domain S-box-containing protein